MKEITKVYIRLVVNFTPGNLRKDYESFILEIISKKGYKIEDTQVFSERIELFLSNLARSPSIITAELTEIGSSIENGLSIETRAKRDESIEHKHHLYTLQRQHKSNLRKLRERQAKYSIDAPISLLNEIEHEESEIARIEAELRSIDLLPYRKYERMTR